MASSATPMADAMTTAQRSHTRSTRAVAAASNVLTPEDDGWALRCRAGWRAPTDDESAVLGARLGRPTRARLGASGRRPAAPAPRPARGSSSAARRARTSSGMAPTMISADTPITPYSSHGVPDRWWTTPDGLLPEVDQRDGGGNGRSQRGEPDRRA